MMITAELVRNIGRKKTLELMLTGKRISAAEAWLTPDVRARPNLTILSGTQIEAVRFDGTRAIGVDTKLLRIGSRASALARTQAEWVAERDAMNDSWSWAELMGNSVHAKTLSDGQRVPKLYDAGEAAELTGGSAHRDGATTRYHELIELYDLEADKWELNNVAEDPATLTSGS